MPNLEGLHSRGPDRGSPKPDQHRRSGFGIRHPEEGGPELPRLLPLPQGEDPLVHGQCGETDLPLLRLRRGGKCLLLPDEDRQHDVSGGRASPGRETGHRPSRPGLHTGGKIPPRFTGKPGPGEPGGRRLLRQNAADGCGLGGTGLPRKKGIRPAVVDAFRLGYAPEGWRALRDHLQRERIALKHAEQAGLLVPRGDGDAYDRFRGRLMFPIEDIHGNVIAFGGRIIGEGEPKYLNSPESALYVKGRHLYGLSRAKNAIRKDETLIIVEGYFDLLALWNAGVANAAATLGTALTREQVDLIRRYTASVAVTFDTDAGGKSALERSMSLFLERGMKARAVVLPDGKDPDEFVSRHGKDAFLDEIRRARPLVDYYIDEVIGTGRNIDERRDALKAALPFIAGIAEPAERGQFMRRVAERLGVDEGLLRQEVTRIVAPQRSPSALPSRPATGIVDPVELSLIRMMIENPERAREIERGNVLACFTSDALKSLGESVVEHSRRARPVRLAEFIDRVQDKTIREKLLESSLSAGSPDEARRNRIFGDTVRRIRQRWYREKQRDLRVRLLRAQEAGDQDLCKRLLDEKERLRHEQKEREG
ncbi:MAG: toprim domain-containing protein [Syntrophaceae bacterium]|nr:toprim domain-containing protein [Syntrophaceae bacterium]